MKWKTKYKRKIKKEPFAIFPVYCAKCGNVYWWERRSFCECDGYLWSEKKLAEKDYNDRLNCEEYKKKFN